MGALLERLQKSLERRPYKRSLEDSVGVEATNSGDAAAEHNVSCSTACERPVSGRLAQSVAASALRAEGRRFDPCTAHQLLLPSGLIALIDNDDVERVTAIRWFAMPSSNRKYHYVASKTRAFQYKMTYLHRFIMEAECGQEVDHVNGNALDNRKANLRFCTHAENTAGRSSGRNTLSGYRGLKFCPKRGRFSAWITVDGKKLFLGSSRSAEEAARIYDQHALRLRGEFARLNFPVPRHT